jgi:hypothetical protein
MEAAGEIHNEQTITRERERARKQAEIAAGLENFWRFQRMFLPRFYQQVG